MEAKKWMLLLCLLLLVFAFYQMTKPNIAARQHQASQASVEEVDYSVVVPPEQLTQFKDTVIYRDPAPPKDSLWMNPSDQELMPPKDRNDPHNGIM